MSETVKEKEPEEREKQIQYEDEKNQWRMTLLCLSVFSEQLCLGQSAYAAWCTPFSKTAVIRRKTHLERCSGSQAKKSWSSSCFKNFWIEKVCKYTYHIKIYNKLLFCYEKPWVLLQAASKACVVKQFCPIPV